MRKGYLLLTGALAVGMFVQGSTPLVAQQWEENVAGNVGEWIPQALRPTGQPVIPIFDGWHAERDGTATLCLGYFNLNFDEALEIPVGPNNYVEPERYNGLQPTYFNPIPLQAGDKPRQYCVFTINVPQGSDERIVWHLRRDYRDHATPAHAGSEEYLLPDIFFEGDRADRGGSMAPFVRFLDPPGPEGIGRGSRGGKRAGPVSVRVGEPLRLSLAVRQPRNDEFPELADYDGGPRTFEVTWAKYSGPPDIPGIVTFSDRLFEVGPVEGTATTTASFQEPGEYVLLVQVHNGSYEVQCCWTNGYVEVNVTE